MLTAILSCRTRNKSANLCVILILEVENLTGAVKVQNLLVKRLLHLRIFRVFKIFSDIPREFGIKYFVSTKAFFMAAIFINIPIYHRLTAQNKLRIE